MTNKNDMLTIVNKHFAKSVSNKGFNPSQPRDKNGRWVKYKHLQGKHDQKTHGRRGGHGEEKPVEYTMDGKPYKSYLSDTKKLIEKREREIIAIAKESPDITPSQETLNMIDKAYSIGSKARKRGLRDEEDIYDYYWNEVKHMDTPELVALHAGLEGVEKPHWVKGWRYGKIPKSGVSRNYAEDRAESGLSVMALSNGMTTRDFGFEIFSNPRPIIYVSGFLNTLKTGSDGEPLLLFPIETGKR